MVALNTEIERGIPKPSRAMAPFPWYGGKGKMAKRILPLIPPGKVYVEPYCGAASLFWHRRPAEVEVLNDLHGEIVNLFRVLQDRRQFVRLRHRLTWTPYSFDEFKRALAGEEHDPVGRAWAFFVRQGQGFSGLAKSPGNWSRAFVSNRGMVANASRWRARIGMLRHWHDRLTRVQIDNRDAIECIRYWDSPDTVFYLDPPYVHETRVKGGRNSYEHEMSDRQHEALIATLLEIRGRAVLSGYESRLYQPLEYAGWKRHEFTTASHAAGKCRGMKIRGTGAATEYARRVEVVWVKSGGGECSTLFTPR